MLLGDSFSHWTLIYPSHFTDDHLTIDHFIKSCSLHHYILLKFFLAIHLSCSSLVSLDLKCKGNYSFAETNTRGKNHSSITNMLSIVHSSSWSIWNSRRCTTWCLAVHMPACTLDRMPSLPTLTVILCTHIVPIQSLFNTDGFLFPSRMKVYDFCCTQLH